MARGWYNLHQYRNGKAEAHSWRWNVNVLEREIEDADLIYTYVHDPASVAGAPLADLAGMNLKMRWLSLMSLLGTHCGSGPCTT